MVEIYIVNPYTIRRVASHRDTSDDRIRFLYMYKPIGAAPGGHFFVGGGGGVWAKKIVMLRGLRISGKKKNPPQADSIVS